MLERKSEGFLPISKVLAGGIPSERLKSDLRQLLDLPNEQLDRIVDYLADTKNPLPTTTQEVLRMAPVVGIEESQLNRHLQLLRHVLNNWQKSKASTTELDEDLKILGYEGQDLDKSSNFFRRLESAKEQYFVVSARAEAEITGLPTIDDLSLTWDIRPIFPPVEWNPDEPTSDLESAWLAHSNILIMEISASRKDGKKEVISLQLSESEFDQLATSIARAKVQLDLIRTKRII